MSEPLIPLEDDHDYLGESMDRDQDLHRREQSAYDNFIKGYNAWYTQFGGSTQLHKGDSDADDGTGASDDGECATDG